MKKLFDKLLSQTGLWILVIAGSLGGIWDVVRRIKKSERDRLTHKGLQDESNRVERGRRAVGDARNSGASPAERLRSNTRHW